MRNDFYDKVLENPSALGNLDYFLRPLFNREPDKVYNLNKALLYQKPSVRNEDEDTEEMLDFDLKSSLKILICTDPFTVDCAENSKVNMEYQDRFL